jgi:hypothetical protein
MIVISLVICDLTVDTDNNEYILDSSKLASIISISILIHLIFVFASESNLKTIITMWPEGYKIHLI